jgi:predicted amidohydrolase YtcJ
MRETALAANPDIVLLNGKCFTGSTSLGFVEALAITGERIVAAGATNQVHGLAGTRTRTIDLRGRTVIPGINDAHFHHVPNPRVAVLPISHLEPSWDEIVDAVAEVSKNVPKGSWILGTHGINVINDPRATRIDLDKVAPNHPVHLTSYFGHGSVVNSAAMAALQIGDEQPDPFGGCCERLPRSNRVSGKLFGYAQWMHWCYFALIESEPERVSSARTMGQQATRLGITSMQIMSPLNPEDYAQALYAAHLPIRARVIRFLGTSLRARMLDENAEAQTQLHLGERIRVSGTKWLLDGTPLERRAAVRSDYRDRPGWRGQTYLPYSKMLAMLRDSFAGNDQLLVHAVGDATIDAFLCALESEADVTALTRRRVRIEHGWGLKADLIPRALAQGVVVVGNPTHLSFAPVIAERFGPRHDYLPVRSLIEAGIPLALGSDGPINPFLGVMFATNNPVRPEEAITREQAIEAYTRGSAYAESQETEKGTLEAGKFADLAVLSQDIFTCPAGDLPNTESVMTMVGGEIVYSS